MAPEHREQQHPAQMIGAVAQVAFRFHHQPCRAQQRIADHQRHAGQDAERRQPVPPAAGILAARDVDALQDGAERNALRQRRQQRSAGKGDVPLVPFLCRAPAEFKGDAAEHQAEQHRDHGRVERRHQHRIGQRERGHQAAAAEHQPGFVAVPDRRDAVHDDVAIALLRKQRKQDAEAEVEAVHHDIDEHGKGDDEGPDGGKVDRDHRAAPSVAAPAAGVMPAERIGTSCDGPCSPGCGGAAIRRSR